LPRALLAAVCEVTGTELDAALAALHQAEFLFETALYPHVEYTFKHPLTHEVAYQSQLTTRRAAVHKGVAQAMERLFGSQVDERAAEIAWHWEGAGERTAVAQACGSKIYELQNVVALARAEVVLGHDDSVDPLLTRAEALIGDMGALAFRPHLAEIRAERARRRGDRVAWRYQLAETHRLFNEVGATGYAARVAKALGDDPPC